MTLLKSVLVAGAVALCVQAASAATIFGFTGASSDSTVSKGFGDPSLNVTVTAGQFASFDATNTPRTVSVVSTSDLVSQVAGRGLGEQHGGATDPMKSVDSGGVSPNNWREALIFTFNQAVRILNVTFYSPTALASQGFVFSGPTLSADPLLNAFTTAAGTAGELRTVSFGSYTGTSFAFGARAQDGAQFYVASMEVEVVPLPAGGLLLVSALALPFLRRKRRAA